MLIRPNTAARSGIGTTPVKTIRCESQDKPTHHVYVVSFCILYLLQTIRHLAVNWPLAYIHITGPKGLETYDWAKAAGLSGFETFWHRCARAMKKGSGFYWPDGVTFVDYPADTGNKDETVRKPKEDMRPGEVAGG